MAERLTKLHILYYAQTSLKDRVTENALRKFPALLETIQFERFPELILPNDLTAFDAVFFRIDEINAQTEKFIERHIKLHDAVFCFIYNSADPAVLWHYSNQSNLLFLPFYGGMESDLRPALHRLIKEREKPHPEKTSEKVRLKQTYQDYPFPLIVLGMRGKILYANPAFQQSFGLHFSDIARFNIHQLFAGVDIQDILKQAQQTEEAYSETKNGSFIYNDKELIPCRLHFVSGEGQQRKHILLFLENLAPVELQQRRFGEQNVSFHLISQIIDFCSKRDEIKTDDQWLIGRLKELFYADHLVLLPLKTENEQPDFGLLNPQDMKMIEPIRSVVNTSLLTQKPSGHQIESRHGLIYRSVFFIPLISNQQKFGMMLFFYLNRFEPTLLQLEAAEMISRLIGSTFSRALYLRKLKASESLFKTAVKNAMNGIYQSTPEGKILFANPALIHMLGYESLEELQALPSAEEIYLNAADRIRFKKELEKNGVIKNSTVKLKKKDGSPLIALENAFIGHDENGRPFYQGSLRNISAYEKLHQQLKEAERFNLDFLNKSGFAIAAFDSSGILKIWNRLAEELTGFSRPEIGEKEAFLRLINYGEHDITEERAYGLIKTNIESKTREKIVLTWDVEELNYPELGPLEVWIGLRTQEEFINSSGNSLNEADYSIINRTVLDFISRFLETAAKQSLPPEKTQGIIREYKKKFEDFERISTVEEISAKPVDASEVAEQTMVVIKDLIPESIRFHKKLNFAGLVQSRKTTLQKVFTHLILNAVESIDGEGEVTFFSQVINNKNDIPNTFASENMPLPCALFRISDSGCGIPPDHTSQIFYPFYTTKDPLKHAGLGLSFVKRMVSALNGRLALESTVQKGTTITLLFPAEQNTLQDNVHPAKEIDQSTTVLVVDDESVIRELISDVLVLKNLKVLTASDGLEGYEKFMAHKDEIGLIILDIIMPGMDGKELYYKIRAENKDVRVIVTSGYSKANIKDELLQAGVEYYLAKPFNINELTVFLDKIFPPKQ